MDLKHLLDSIETYSLPDALGVPLDKKIIVALDKLGLLTNGTKFFVEAGANDGVTQSNTLLLERYFGWKGLLVEPCLQNYQKCLCFRGERCHVVRTALVGDETVSTVDGNFVTVEDPSRVDYDSLMNRIVTDHQAVRHHQQIVSVPATTLRKVVNGLKLHRSTLCP